MTLPSEAVESLRELTRGELQRTLPEPHAQMLVEQGYAQARDGKTVITPLGGALLAMQSQIGTTPLRRAGAAEQRGPASHAFRLRLAL